MVSRMPRPAEVTKLSGLSSRFAAFVAERYPYSLPAAIQSFDAAGLGQLKPGDVAKLDAGRTAFRRHLARELYTAIVAPEGIADTTPGVSAVKRLELARAELVEAC